MYKKKQNNFRAIFSNFGPIFVIFARNFPEGVIIISKVLHGTIANKFQFDTYFRFGYIKQAAYRR